MTKAYFLCEVPLRKIYHLGFALFSLQALTADPPGQEFCMQAQCSMGAPIYLSDAERTFKPTCFPFTETVRHYLPYTDSLWANQQLPALSLGNTGTCCNLPTELRASPFSSSDTRQIPYENTLQGIRNHVKWKCPIPSIIFFKRVTKF